MIIGSIVVDSFNIEQLLQNIHVHIHFTILHFKLLHYLKAIPWANIEWNHSASV